ncbi:single-stranded-DNA-specific exonuclease RecJ [Aminobacterium mobile]|uniref:single-stranded-DNA-specific exonuclease RecJ n=1 Tax=Aminobacterium mobile TaxID=81467 RepID=UPI00046749F7|nr:DHH family phosphoesterase [Aminobacterium mobile]
MTSFCLQSKLNIIVPSNSTRYIAEQLDCPPLVAAVLELQGRVSPHNIDKARAWLCPSLDFLLPQCYLGASAEEAARMWHRLPSLGNVVVYGDYDVDGVASTTLAMEICCSRAQGVRFYIPHRHLEGYGLHRQALLQLVEAGCNTLMVVDCGTKDTSLLAEARSLGLNVFVFDHHLPDREDISDPYVVNPQIDGDMETRRLCATSVLWLWAFLFDIMPKKWLYERLDLVALATIADCVPLEMLNRSLVKEGLDVMRSTPRQGLRHLFSRLGLAPYYLNEEQLAMKVIPCLNAAGRLSFADLAVKVLVGEEPGVQNVEELVSLNRKRQNLSSRITREASKVAEEKDRHVLFQESWPIGVLSGVASRLCSERNVPVVLAAPVRNWIRGTLRMPAGGNAVQVLDCISDRLEAWGGHKQAAGFSVSKENWQDIEIDLERMLSNVECEEPEISAINIHPSQINMKTWQSVADLGPFGIGNPYPLLFCEKSEDEKILPLGKTGTHLKIQCGEDSLVAFNGVHVLNSIASSNIAGWVYHPRFDYWRGQLRLQFMLDYVIIEP